MKILHVVHAYPPSVGGSQWLTAQFSERLVADYGDQVTVFTTVARNIDYFWGKSSEALPAGIEEINGVTVRRFPVFRRLNWLRWFASGVAWRLQLPYNDYLRTLEMGPMVAGLRQAIATSQADVVFATAFPLLHMYSALAGAKQGGIPIVLLGAIHLDDPWGYQRPMIFEAIRRADAYIAHTTFERDFLVNQYNIPTQKISVIGGGVALELFAQANGARLRAAMGWGAEPMVLALGKHVARKRFDLLLAAMPAIWAETPTVRLVLAGGRTDYTPQIEQMIAQLPSEHRSHVTLLTDVSESVKADLLAACDLFVLPSGHESFGLVFAEAWACGKPVIGARSGAIPSLIDEGVDGLLFDFPSAQSLTVAIRTLLAQPALRQEMGQQGRNKVVANFTWQVVTAQLRKLYQEVSGTPIGG